MMDVAGGHSGEYARDIHADINGGDSPGERPFVDQDAPSPDAFAGTNLGDAMDLFQPRSEADDDVLERAAALRDATSAAVGPAEFDSGSLAPPGPPPGFEYGARPEGAVEAQKAGRRDRRPNRDRPAAAAASPLQQARALPGSPSRTSRALPGSPLRHSPRTAQGDFPSPGFSGGPSRSHPDFPSPNGPRSPGDTGQLALETAEEYRARTAARRESEGRALQRIRERKQARRPNPATLK